MGTYRVSAGTQVHHEGVVYGQGDTFEATAEQVGRWLAEGWVVAVVDKSKRSARNKPRASA